MSNTVTFPESTSRAQTLVDLWNSTKSVGLEALHSHNQPTILDAESHFSKTKYVDYWFGKPIKTNFSDYPILKPNYYDRVAGVGTMQKVADFIVLSEFIKTLS